MEKERKVTEEDIPSILPALIPPIPLCEYIIGADFAKEDNVSSFSIFNKTTGKFHGTTQIFTPSRDNFEMFSKALSAYFNAPIFEEV